ncbi:hypothetical protein PYH37_000943 [Sinorhizobium numidicum]|uniref:Uncharacterized protein n=1 Tax=Sinorhizobium numidicum TaxID=680248 RepID=A0ABY8CSF1_9HYPH|nr:hypothetical protein [Sinorhizobium numidicum]WEX75522.1 hypothetical protein PYH37_000943 [Sinorhizobium numidicum]WEX81519.1 hypothetical protein PYH38_000944 [Sinorhizobium numidicum]
MSKLTRILTLSTALALLAAYSAPFAIDVAKANYQSDDGDGDNGDGDNGDGDGDDGDGDDGDDGDDDDDDDGHGKGPHGNNGFGNGGGDGVPGNSGKTDVNR